MPIDSFARDLAAAALQKQGGGGGGGGTGDMEKKVYDPTGAVEDKGGIPAYVSGVAKPLTVTLTETSAGSGKYTADKTYDDIKAAYDNHVPIQALLLNGASGDAVLPMMNAEVSGDGAGFTFGYTQLQNDAQTAAMRSIHYLHTATVDEWTDNDQSAEYLNVNTGGTVLGNINMGQNAITNAQEIHIDGTAPLYLGSTVKAAGTAGVRITGTTNGEAAVVAPDSQSTFRPINVGEPTAQSHAVPKSTVDAALESKADASAVAAALGEKADKTTVESQLEDKASKTDLSNYLKLTGGTVNGNFAVIAPDASAQICVTDSKGAYLTLGDINFGGANPPGAGLVPNATGAGLKVTGAGHSDTLVTISHANGVADADSATVGQMNAALANKADAATVNAALAQKANTADVNSALANKADTAAVNAALANKADISALDAKITGGTTDIGVGAALASGTLYVVYE